MKKFILLASLVFIQVAAFAEPAATKAAETSSFTNPNNIFMMIGITLVASFVLVPVYSMSRAVKVLAKKVAEK